ncbi:hypothetical protein BDW62DRAFT_10194 [Aspergillus aurantiobrunneus]
MPHSTSSSFLISATGTVSGDIEAREAPSSRIPGMPRNLAAGYAPGRGAFKHDTCRQQLMVPPRAKTLEAVISPMVAVNLTMSLSPMRDYTMFWLPRMELDGCRPGSRCMIDVQATGDVASQAYAVQASSWSDQFRCRPASDVL